MSTELCAGVWPGGPGQPPGGPRPADALPLQVRTLFVSGLPLDIKPRELYLLFRPFKGYEGSLIKLTSKQPVGFVSFDSRSEAEAAKNALNVSAGTPWGTPKEMDPSIYYLVETSWGSPVPPHPHIKAKCC